MKTNARNINKTVAEPEIINNNPVVAEPEIITSSSAAPEAEVLNPALPEAPEAEQPEQPEAPEQAQEQAPEAPEAFKGLSFGVKKQLINIDFTEAQDGIFKIIISHKTNPLSFPDIVIASASLNQILAFAANGLNAVLNDNSGSRKSEKWAEIEAYLKHGFLTKSDYLSSLPKSKIASAAQINEWVDDVIVLTINQTKELDQERKSKLISRLYSDDAAIRESAFNIAKAWIEALSTVKADYTLKLTVWRQEQAKAAITPLLNAIDIL